MFKGFYPREKKERIAFLENIKDRQETIILYESPYRIIDCLSSIKENLGNRRIAVCRELTKLHEQIVRGTIEEVINYFVENTPKGEFVLVLEGKTKEEIEIEKKSEWEDLTIEEHILKYMNSGESKKNAMKLVAKDRGISKSEVYKYSLDL